MTITADSLPAFDLADDVSESASLYAMVMRGVRNLRLRSPLERALLSHIKSAARSVGNQILNARDQTDLQRRLHDAILSDAFARYNEDASVALTPKAIREMLARLGSRLEPNEDIVQVLGPQHAATLRRAAPLVIAHTSATLQFLARIPEEALRASSAMATDLRCHLTDPL